MKQATFLILFSVLFIGSCQYSTKQTDNQKENNLKKEETMTLSELFNAPEQFEGQEINVKGLCVHTCRHGGKRMFLQGAKEEEFLLVTASGNISHFSNDLEGSEIIVSGNLNVPSSLPTQKDQHAHHDEDTCSNESKAKDLQLECVAFSIAQQ